jgi:hypothetical protein
LNIYILNMNFTFLWITFRFHFLSLIYLENFSFWFCSLFRRIQTSDHIINMHIQYRWIDPFNFQSLKTSEVHQNEDSTLSPGEGGGDIEVERRFELLSELRSFENSSEIFQELLFLDNVEINQWFEILD